MHTNRKLIFSKFSIEKSRHKWFHMSYISIRLIKEIIESNDK